MAKTAWILRGPPGSGKTRVASQLLTLPGDIAYISLDKIREDGGYVDDWETIKQNMQEDVAQMKGDFRKALHEGADHVILDNTHSRKWEYDWAVKAAEGRGYIVHIIEVQTDVFTCARRQTKPVPMDKLAEFFVRWESPVQIPDKLDLLVQMLKVLV